MVYGENFFNGILDEVDDETVLPNDKFEKHGNITEKEFLIDEDLIKYFSQEFDLNTIFISCILFNLTKFTYSKKILISNLYKKEDQQLDKIVFGGYINTTDNVETFLNKINHRIIKTKEYEKHFSIFKKCNNLVMPDFQYFYSQEDKCDNLNLLDSNLSLIIKKKKNNVKINFIYNDGYYSEKLIRTFYNSFIIVLNKFKEKNTLLKDISIKINSSKSYKLQKTTNTTLNKLFEKVVEKNIDKIALIAEDKKLTYGELDKLSNRIANALIKRNLNIEDRVIINLKRDTNLVIAIFGVIKAGGQFILMDSNDPAERINFIKRDTNAKYIIGNNQQLHGLIMDTLLEERDESNPNIDLNPDNLFCIVYTSGSTGKPKGVMLAHETILSEELLDSFTYFKIEDVFLLNLNQAFIGFIGTLLLFLYKGLKVVLANEKECYDVNSLIPLFKKTKFEIMHVTPSMIEEYMENESFLEILKYIKIIIFGGEKLSKKLIKKIKKISNADLYNLYGSTETPFSNINLINNDSYIIGKPVINVFERVVDVDGNPLPPYVVGEMWIGGLRVAKGYWNSKKLSQERFITIDSMPFFKSGDLAKYDENEGYDVIGRVDSQIKLRGQRIDPGEIENNVPINIGVEKSVVVVNNKNTNQILSLYFTTKSKYLKDDEILKIKENIKNHLKDRLPSFMIPQVYIYLNEFPKTRTGKISRNDLKDYDDDINEIIEPSTDLEREIFDLSADILGHDNFGVTNDLLSIGFTSLNFLRLKTKVNKIYGVDLPFIIDYGNIKTVANNIENSNEYIPVKHEYRDFYPLTYSQTYYYDYIKKNLKSLEYNMAFSLNFRDFNVFKLRDALLKTVELNSYIKTCLCENDDGIYQKRNDKYEADVKIFNKKLTRKIEREFIKPFNVFEPPLFRFELYYQDMEVNLLMDVHHIISDVYSIDIFVIDLIKEYYGDIPEKKYDYFDYTIDQLQISSSDKKQSKYYFLNIINDFSLDYYMKPSPIRLDYNLISKSIVYKNKFNELLKKYDISEDDLILSAITMCLTKFLNIDNILVNYVFNGRYHGRYFDTFGYFAQVIPLFFKVDEESSIQDYLKNIKKVKNFSMKNSYNFDPRNLIEDYLNCERKIYIQYNYFDKRKYNPYFSDNENLSNKYHIKNVHANKIKSDDFLGFNVNKNSNLIELKLEYIPAYYSDDEINVFLSNLSLLLELMVNNQIGKIRDWLI
ncbi:MAG: AMP-binding protein [Methanobrevibacter sp.]|jgi:amino acid adenylation domain-containing protein|nr:AMP-binding protein [Candidatus Methanovirga basalitermitum]